jgi:hypothetical protein
MKTVSVRVQDETLERMQRLAEAQGKGFDEFLSEAVAGLAGVWRHAPSPAERRRQLDQLWERIDTCNVEVGERPSRARTYDQRRFHRY